MRKLLFILLAIPLMAGCACQGNGSADESEDVVKSADVAAVQVLYFHGNRRCATCQAIEKRTKEVLEERFADEMSQGRIVFREINYDEKDGAVMAEQYKVAGSSLIIVPAKGKPANNMTNFAFTTARNRPDEFKEGISRGILNVL